MSRELAISEQTNHLKPHSDFSKRAMLPLGGCLHKETRRTKGPPAAHFGPIASGHGEVIGKGFEVREQQPAQPPAGCVMGSIFLGFSEPISSSVSESFNPYLRGRAVLSIEGRDLGKAQRDLLCSSRWL